MVLAGLDIGSNTLRLLVAEPAPSGNLRRLFYRQKITRLLDETTGSLRADAIPLSLDVIEDFRRQVNQFAASRCRILCTEAMRNTAEKGHFLSAVRRIVGVPIDLLSGIEEARLSALGVLSILQPASDFSFIFDLGGGSIEFSFCQGRHQLWHASYPAGVIRLAAHGGMHQLEALIGCLRTDLSTTGLLLKIQSPDCSFIGTAGTVTTLASLQMKLETYHPDAINGFNLDIETLDQLESKLQGLTIPERERLPGMEEGRGQLILAGLHCVQRLLVFLKKPGLVVSDAGLLEGALMEMAVSD